MLSYVYRQRLLAVEVFHDQLQRAARIQLVEIHKRLSDAFEKHLTLLLCLRNKFGKLICHYI